MAPPKIILTWRGPYLVTDFFTKSELKREFSSAGVYIWIEDEPKEHLSYVGKAGGSPTLFVRQQQHYANMIGGLYTIPKAYRTDGDDWIPDRSRGEVADVLLSPDRFHKLVDDGFAYSKHCMIYLALVNSADIAKVVERQLLYDLQPTGTKWGLSTPPRSPIAIVHRNAAWATEEILEQAKVLDLAD